MDTEEIKQSKIIDMIMTWEIKVKGKVQGVYFRVSTQRNASKLGITGWVRNHRDGSVRIMAQGTESNLGSFLKWVHQGPDRAVVDQVTWEKVDIVQNFKEFEIRR